MALKIEINNQRHYKNKMNFCTECNNMYYLKLAGENDNSLVYYCRNCGHEDTSLANESVCITNTTLRRSTQKYTHHVNAYTKTDPTLPRTAAIRCPNQSCESNKDKKKQEVIYLRYDDENMKYLYICKTCDHTWSTSS